MFSGIVQGMAKVREAARAAGQLRLTLALPAAQVEGLQIGASVAVAGVCLTATSIDGPDVRFDVVGETLAQTNLGQLQTGDRVNVERSVRVGDEIGGHNVSGHIDGTAQIVAVDTDGSNTLVRYEAPAPLMAYILRKGFVALDGCSLTVATVDRAQHQFSVALIPETLRATTHGAKRAGDRVNLEVDRQTQAIVETVRQLLAEGMELPLPR